MPPHRESLQSTNEYAAASFSHQAELLEAAKVEEQSGRPEISDDEVIEAMELQFAKTLAERHPKWPQVNLNMSLGGHKKVEDGANLPTQIRQSHIYLYEDTAGPYLKAGYQEIADRSVSDLRTTEDAVRLIHDLQINGHLIAGSYTEQELRGLVGSKVAVGHIDLNEDKPDDAQLINRIDKAYNSRPPLSENIDGTLSRIHSQLAQSAALQQEREATIISRLENEIAAILAERPDLMAQDELNITFSVGGYHTMLGHGFNDAGVDTKRTFAQIPYIYTPEEEARRTLAFGKEPSRELLAKVLMSTVITDEINKSSDDDIDNNTQDVATYLQQSAGAFSFDEITDIHNKLYHDNFSYKDLNQVFIAKGLDPLPHNQAELKAAVIKQRERLHHPKPHQP